MWKEQPIMTAALPEQRLFLAILTSVAGLAVCWLTTTPFGLLAPIGTLYLYDEGRAVCCFARLWQLHSSARQSPPTPMQTPGMISRRRG
jgi:hypothetical protein